MVSCANARGVMQVMPGTWDYVQQNLAGRPAQPASATDNVRAGVLYLQHLLQQTGGDESAAIAGYYQGLGAVRSRGLFDDTQQYVANVQALRSRFGGRRRLRLLPRDWSGCGAERVSEAGGERQGEIEGSVTQKGREPASS